MAVDEVIQKRIHSGEAINLPNGKLLERLLVLKMYRENISTRSSYYNPSRKDKEDRAVDETKAPFFKQLLPLAQKKMDGIRYLALNLLNFLNGIIHFF